jgi:hypothetical protein
MKWITPLILLYALASCVDSGQVRVIGEKGEGYGAVLDARTVAVPEHIAQPPIWVETATGWVSARVIERRPSGPEELVILEIMGKLPPPAKVREIRPGDSGRPLYTADGKAVGLIAGWSGEVLVVHPLVPRGGE